MTNDSRKSDTPIVPTKVLNNAADAAAEVLEGRGVTKGNARQTPAGRTQSRETASCGLERVRHVAKEDKNAKFTALLHHVTIERLRRSFFHLKKMAAPGIDGMTWSEYRVDLEVNLIDLHGRLHRGAYRASPTRRVFIPKTDGRQRPLGIAVLEDKIVQRAVVEVLNAIYETDFLGFSYGFRPGRSQHDALDALAYAIRYRKVNEVFDADICGFFDAIDHKWMMRFVEHRIADKRIQRLIRKWLRAGVMEEVRWTASKKGSPQGATISPLLSNIYLHYALDQWAHQWRQRHARGEVILVRYADDVVVGFQYRGDAVRFGEALRHRLQKFSLELHPEKTRQLQFGRYAAERRAERGLGKPETFDFLGFTHICAKTRNGRFQLRRKTIGKRLRAKLEEVRADLKRRLHHSIPQQGRWLGQVMRGYFQYHAVPTNIRSLQTFRRQVERSWLHVLRRRSQKDRTTWTRQRCLSTRWLPTPKILHPWPAERFIVNTRGRSPVR